MAFGLRAFFDARKLVLYPVVNMSIVAFDGALFGTLWAPAHLPQDFADVVEVVLDAELFLDQLRNPRGSKDHWGSLRPWPL
jgi:hypothetical protein